jgi:alpha-tubulin suppressor-like RCC1 family protein
MISIVNQGVDKIASGYYYSLILKNGSAYSTGYNTDGQLCVNDNNQRNLPTLISGNYKDISSGASHTLLLDSNGILFSCGNNIVFFFHLIL